MKKRKILMLIAGCLLIVLGLIGLALRALIPAELLFGASFEELLRAARFLRLLSILPLGLRVLLFIITGRFLLLVSGIALLVTRSYTRRRAVKQTP